MPDKPLDNYVPTSMDLARDAFQFLGWAVNLNGRRLWKAYRLSRTRIVDVQLGSPMLYAPMAPRKERRAKQGKKFRPVYGYQGPGQDMRTPPVI